MNRAGRGRARWTGKPRNVGAPRDASIKYRQALAWLYSLQRFGIKLGLENIRHLLLDLHIVRGRARVSRAVFSATPKTSHPRVIHVAGTNGKGSVCAMIDSICRAQGYRTGLFISPHLITFRERIRVNGKMTSEDAVANGLTLIRELVADWEPHPTFFEVTTALALKYFAKTNLNVVILETGMGGRLDATNAIQSDVAVITPIDFDHERWLGNTLTEITVEKAGIIKPKVPVVSSPQRADAEKVIRARARECKAPLKFVTESYEASPIALRGDHQKQNAAVAIAAIRAAELSINDKAIMRGLASIDWPARFQQWDECTVIDGAHNPAAARVLAEAWRETFGDQQATVILAVLSDKNLRGICEALAPIANSVLLPKMRSERAASPEELAKVIPSINPLLPYSIVPSVGEALSLAHAKSNPILITGSLHFAGEVLAHLRGKPAAFEESAQ